MIDVHPAASDEAEVAHYWYLERSPVAAARFLEELDRAVSEIGRSPEHGATYLHGTRCYLLRRFPYLLVYHQPRVDVVEVVAVAHGRKRPGYWVKRKD